MNSQKEIKEIVRQKYSEIALQNRGVNVASCCGAGECSIETANIMTDDYSILEAYNPDADLCLGCVCLHSLYKSKKVMSYLTWEAVQVMMHLLHGQNWGNR